MKPLPLEYLERVYANTLAHRPRLKTIENAKKYLARPGIDITGAFPWQYSQEGPNFWRAVASYQVGNASNLPELPLLQEDFVPLINTMDLYYLSSHPHFKQMTDLRNKYLSSLPEGPSKRERECFAAGVIIATICATIADRNELLTLGWTPPNSASKDN